MHPFHQNDKAVNKNKQILHKFWNPFYTHIVLSGINFLVSNLTGNPISMAYTLKGTVLLEHGVCHAELD